MVVDPLQGAVGAGGMQPQLARGGLAARGQLVPGGEAARGLRGQFSSMERARDASAKKGASFTSTTLTVTAAVELSAPGPSFCACTVSE